MITSNYSCSQSALYQAGRNVLASLSDNLAAFTDFKAKYNSGFITDTTTIISTAEGMQDYQSRSSQSEIDYIILNESLVTCLNMWQNLKRYVLEAYPPSQQKARLDEAGNLSYEKANKKNWDSANALLQTATNFILLHQTELENGLNMPPTFNQAYNDFKGALLTYQQGSEDVKVNTDLKITTNNNLYATIIGICLDGQQIFRNNPPLKEQFTFTSILSIVAGNGTNGFKGYITNGTTTLTIAGAQITTVPPTKMVQSDPDGYYEIVQIPSGTYTIFIHCLGFQPHTINDYQVDSGITHNLSLTLNPIPVVV